MTLVFADPDPAPSTTDADTTPAPGIESAKQVESDTATVPNDAVATPAPAKRSASPRTLTIEAASPLPSGDEPAKKTDVPPSAKSCASAISPPPDGDKTSEPLTKQMKSLRTRVRRVLKSYYNRPLNSRDNDPWEMMHGMLAYGVHSQSAKAARKASRSRSSAGCATTGPAKA